MLKKPWERRLKDLFYAYQNCTKAYFDPELFRMNLNNFLQTSRTVTFIIQKNKKDIPDFDIWYQDNVLSDLKGDQLMEWAKDSRNIIEKQGDLEMYSTANATLFFSYIEENDIPFIGCAEILHINVKRLIRLAQKRIPTATLDSSAIQIERRWVANSLPDWELLHALAMVYAKLYKSCKKLALYLGDPIGADVPSSLSAEYLRNEGRNVLYVKIKNLKTYSVKYEIEKMCVKERMPDNIKSIFSDVKRTSELRNIKNEVEYIAEIAAQVFNEFGFHRPFLFLFDESYQIIDMLGMEPSDQVDKYIFWRGVGERAKLLNATSLIWVAESWIRSTKEFNKKSIQNLEVIGECLMVDGITHTGEAYRVSWDILRQEPNLVGLLGNRQDGIGKDEVSNYWIPFLKDRSTV